MWHYLSLYPFSVEINFSGTKHLGSFKAEKKLDEKIKKEMFYEGSHNSSSVTEQLNHLEMFTVFTLLHFFFITCDVDVDRRRCRACLVDCHTGIVTTVRSQDFFNNKSAVLSNVSKPGPRNLRNIIFGPLYFLSGFISYAS